MIRFAFSRKIVTNGILFRTYHGLTGGQIVYKKLKENNVKDVWISTGGAVMPLVDAFYSGDINYYLPSHEQSEVILLQVMQNHLVNLEYQLLLLVQVLQIV